MLMILMRAGGRVPESLGMHKNSSWARIRVILGLDAQDKVVAAHQPLPRQFLEPPYYNLAECILDSSDDAGLVCRILLVLLVVRVVYLGLQVGLALVTDNLLHHGNTASLEGIRSRNSARHMRVIQQRANDTANVPHNSPPPPPLPHPSENFLRTHARDQRYRRIFRYGDRPLP